VMTPAILLPRPLADWAFFLDVDGTLVDIAPTPEDVRVEPALLETLAHLRRRTDGAVALVSGRRIDDIDRLFSPLRLPAAGIHGNERRRADGRLEEAAPPPALTRLRQAIERFLPDVPGVLFEDKGLAVSLHYRLAPQCEEAVRDFARRAIRDAGPDLKLLEGKMVVEFKPAQGDKGRAILRFLDEPPFAGRRPLFAGDDVTDEDGFAAVNRVGGLSIRIGPDRPSAARATLPSVAAFHAWLAEASADNGTSPVAHG
jgi:trehalose 6-phosphate phosphatase